MMRTPPMGRMPRPMREGGIVQMKNGGSAKPNMRSLWMQLALLTQASQALYGLLVQMKIFVIGKQYF